MTGPGEPLHLVGEAPTAEEFDEMMRQHQRHVAIPARAHDVLQWMQQVRATPGDPRHGNRRLKSIESLARKARQSCEDDFLLALYFASEMEAHISALNRAIDMPQFELAARVREGGRKGARSRWPEDEQAAKRARYASAANELIRQRWTRSEAFDEVARRFRVSAGTVKSAFYSAKK